MGRRADLIDQLGLLDLAGDEPRAPTQSLHALAEPLPDLARLVTRQEGHRGYAFPGSWDHSLANGGGRKADLIRNLRDPAAFRCLILAH